MAVGQDNSGVPNGGSNAVKNDQPAASNRTEETWDEQRIEDALKTLKEMHVQLRGLRTTVPRLIAPLTKKQPSPENLFHEFSTSAATANQEVQQFRRLMSNEGSVKVLERSKNSRAENPNGIKPWKVTEHQDWLTRDT